MATSIAQAAQNALARWLTRELDGVTVWDRWPEANVRLPAKAISVLRAGTRRDEALDPEPIARRDVEGAPGRALFTWRMRAEERSARTPRARSEAWCERLLRLEEDLVALAVDWPLALKAHPDLSAAVEIARDGLAFMLPAGDEEILRRMHRMRRAQLGIKEGGDHRGIQMTSAASAVLDAVNELLGIPEAVREDRVELAVSHLTRTLSLRVPAEFGPGSGAVEALRRAGAKKRFLAWASRYTPKRPTAHSGGMTLAAITAHVLHEAGAFGLARGAAADEIAETTKALGVYLQRYELGLRVGRRAELARRRG